MKRLAENYRVEMWTLDEFDNVQNLRYQRLGVKGDYTNYTKNEITAFNARLKKIEKSLKDNGYLETAPITLVHIDGVYYREDGQGRDNILRDLKWEEEIPVLIIEGLTLKRAQECMRSKNTYLKPWVTNDLCRSENPELMTYIANVEKEYPKLSSYYINMFLLGSTNLKKENIVGKYDRTKPIEEYIKPNAFKHLNYINNLAKQIDALCDGGSKSIMNTDMANYFYRLFNAIDDFVEGHNQFTKEELFDIVGKFMTYAADETRSLLSKGKAENWSKWSKYFVANKSQIKTFTGANTNKYVKFLNFLVDYHK